MKNLICYAVCVAAVSILAVGCTSDYGKYVQLENIPVTSSSGMISPRNAIDIALSHAGVDAASAKIEKCETDHEWGTVVYEIEFERGLFEYEYEIDARNGKILSSEKSWDW